MALPQKNNSNVIDEVLTRLMIAKNGIDAPEKEIYLKNSDYPHCKCCTTDVIDQHTQCMCNPIENRIAREKHEDLTLTIEMTDNIGYICKGHEHDYIISVSYPENSELGWLNETMIYGLLNEILPDIAACVTAPIENKENKISFTTKNYHTLDGVTIDDFIELGRQLIVFLL